MAGWVAQPHVFFTSLTAVFGCVTNKSTDSSDPFDHLWRRFCQAGGARNSRQKSAHIPFAVGVGRSGPSQPRPGSDEVPSVAYPLSLSAEGDPGRPSSLVLLAS